MMFLPLSLFLIYTIYSRPHPSLGLTLKTTARDWGRPHSAFNVLVYQDRRTSPFIPDLRAHSGSAHFSWRPARENKVRLASVTAHEVSPFGVICE
jgi:hypothetical protein